MGGICGTHGLSHALHSMASATGRRRAAVWRGMAAVAVTFGRLGECHGCALDGAMSLMDLRYVPFQRASSYWSKPSKLTRVILESSKP